MVIKIKIEKDTLKVEEVKLTFMKGDTKVYPQNLKELISLVFTEVQVEVTKADLKRRKEDTDELVIEYDLSY